MDSAVMMMTALIAVGGVVIAVATYYAERKRQMDWHHKMMCDAWQEGWDAACEMMKHREESKENE